MTDLAPLHRRLRRALDLSAMLALGALAPACASTPDQDAGQGKTEVTKTEVIKTEVIKTEVIKTDPIKAEPLEPEPLEPEPPKPEPEPPKPEPTITITKNPPKPDPLPIGRMPTIDRIPRCPTVDWCGTRVLVEAMRPTRLASPPADAEGCPSVIQRQDRRAMPTPAATSGRSLALAAARCSSKGGRGSRASSQAAAGRPTSPMHHPRPRCLTAFASASQRAGCATR